jgi:isoquinoline 1-oxidoreductase beta subunit
MGRARTIARRGFMIGSAAILGGVAFGAYLVARATPNPLLDGLAEGETALTPFVKITREGVTLIVPRADVGQGVASTQAMLIAEELDIDPGAATLDPGQPHPAYFNGTVAADGMSYPGWDQGFVAETVRDLMMTVARLSGSQFTGGSSSIADLHETLRRAGATPRGRAARRQRPDRWSPLPRRARCTERAFRRAGSPSLRRSRCARRRNGSGWRRPV